MLCTWDRKSERTQLQARSTAMPTSKQGSETIAVLAAVASVWQSTLQNERSSEIGGVSTKRSKCAACASRSKSRAGQDEDGDGVGKARQEVETIDEVQDWAGGATSRSESWERA